MMQKEQKLIQEEAQQAVLQAAASQPAAMAGATVGQAAAAADSSSTAAPAKVGFTQPTDTASSTSQGLSCLLSQSSCSDSALCLDTMHHLQPLFSCRLLTYFAIC
jgi:hypothetical protein